MRSFWLSIGSLVTAVLLAGGAYRYGLFFDEAFYQWEWLLCLAGLLAVGVVGLVSMVKAKRGALDNRIGWLRPARPAALGLLLVALLYGFALLHDPVSILGSLKQVLRYCSYAAFMLLLYIGFGSKERRVWLSGSLQASGMVVAGGALAGWMGVLSFPSMIMITGDVRLSAVGARLAGFVQYPNFMGAVACAYFIWSLVLLVKASTFRGFGVAAVGAMPYVLVSLLTESRGAWLAVAVVWTAGCVLMRGKERLAWLLYSAWTTVCGAAAYRAVVDAGVRGQKEGAGGGAALSEWLILLILCAVASAGLFGLHMLVRRVRGALIWRMAWVGGALSIACTLLLLPSAIHGRLTSGSAGYETVGARALFYRDAWRMIREAPLLGRGGDTWRSLLTGIQSQPYVGNEVHSGYLELVIDVGVVGLLAGMILLVTLLWPIWKNERTGLLPIGVLLLHAIIDFDMSFGYYWLLLLSWVVYYLSSADEMKRHAEQAVIGGSRRLELSRRRRLLPGVRTATMSAAAVCFAAAAALGWRFDAAVQHREAAVAASGAARTAALRAALEANPYWTRIRLELAAYAPPQDRAALLAAGLRYEPQSVPLLWALGRQYAARADVERAALYMRRALAVDRFDRGKQTEAVVTMTQLAQTMRAASRFEAARFAADAAEAFYESYKALDRRYAVNDRRFGLSAAARTAAEQNRLLASTARRSPQE